LEEKNYGEPTFFSIHARIGRLRYLAWYFVLSMPWAAIPIIYENTYESSTGYSATVALILGMLHMALHFVTILIAPLPLFFSAHRLRDMGRSA